MALQKIRPRTTTATIIPITKSLIRVSLQMQLNSNWRFGHCQLTVAGPILNHSLCRRLDYLRQILMQGKGRTGGVAGASGNTLSRCAEGPLSSGCNLADRRPRAGRHLAVSHEASPGPGLTARYLRAVAAL